MAQDYGREWLTVEQTAEYLQCSRDMIRAYIHSGKLPAAQLSEGGRYRIKAIDIDKMLEKSVTTLHK
jgi:excisionase family DNA binding protein